MLEQGALDKLRHRTLEAVLAAVQEVYAEATKSSPASPSLSDSTLAPRKKPESGLRYSYAEPKRAATPKSPGSASSGTEGRSRRRSKPQGTKSPRSPLERAAELADFKAMGRSMLAEDELALDELRLGGR